MPIMTDALKPLLDIEKDIVDRRDVARVLRRLSQVADRYHASGMRGRIDDIADDYHRMRDYFLQGYADPQLDVLYRRLLCQLMQAARDMELDARLAATSQLSAMVGEASRGEDELLSIDSLRTTLENDVAEAAMLSLEGGQQREAHAHELYQRHYATLQHLFNAIVCSHQWRKEYADQFALLMVSPSVDAQDALLFTSALMLAHLLVPDAGKVMALIRIFRTSTDERLRQRALVGWVFAVAAGGVELFGEVQQAVDEMLSDDTVCAALLDMQGQVVCCQNAERASDELRRDVMPSLLKSQNLRMGHMGLGSGEESNLDDILHPDEDDKRMEDLEKSLHKMADMQRKGTDIYFGGFAQMKRFSFFGRMANWFMPFSPAHPEMERMPEALRHSNFLEKLLEEGPFCDSDKYSFAIGLCSVFQRLPEAVQSMLAHGEASLATPMGDDLDRHSPTYLRRMYLQDLYRFFRLSDGRHAFTNPFGGEATPSLFFASPSLCRGLSSKQGALVRFLLRRGEYDSLRVFFDQAPVQLDQSTPVDILLGRASLAVHENDYARAARLYGWVADLQPDDAAVLRRYADASLRNGDSDKALKAYHTLAQLRPLTVTEALGQALALINSGSISEAVTLLYKLDYEHPHSSTVRRTLAWGLLWADRPSDAQNIYNELTHGDETLSDDWLNAGYCQWVLAHRERAQVLFQKFVEETNRGTVKTGAHPSTPFEILGVQFKADKALLAHYNVSDTEMKMMADIPQTDEKP